MKHYYLLLVLLISHVTLAQDAALFANNWYLTNLIIDGKDNFPPSNEEVKNIPLDFIQENNSLQTNVCNEGWSENINFSSENNIFTIDNFYQTLILCNNIDNEKYEPLYFSFFSMKTAADIFSYTISESDGIKTLVLTSDNDQAIYSNQQLSTNRFKVANFSIYPNPTNNFINISIANKNIEHAKVRMYDSLGKLCKSQNVDNQNSVINIKNLEKGLYFIKIETDKSIETQKIIIN